MITEQERRELIAAWGELRDQPGWAEEQVAGLQALRLLGELLVEMDKRNITQADLGRAMGVHRRQILRWLRGDGALKADTLIAMGRHVGLRLDARWVEVDVGLERGGVSATVEVSEGASAEGSADFALAA